MSQGKTFVDSWVCFSWCSEFIDWKVSKVWSPSRLKRWYCCHLEVCDSMIQLSREINGWLLKIEPSFSLCQWIESSILNVCSKRPSLPSSFAKERLCMFDTCLPFRWLPSADLHAGQTKIPDACRNIGLYSYRLNMYGRICTWAPN